MGAASTDVEDDDLTLGVIRSALAIADEAVIADLEGLPDRANFLDGSVWIDCRPLFDPRLHAPEIVGMQSQRLAYGICRNLLETHPRLTYLLRILRRP
jgi:hypothetical protein